MPILPDGSVLPSFFGVEDRSSHTPGPLMTMSDSVLRVGEVIGAYAPDDPQNVSKVEVEYLVRVNRRDGAGSPVQTPYRCVMKDGFGTQGDHLRHSLRPRDSEQEHEVLGNGAIVLIACVNADMSQAVILDCLRHPKRTDTDPPGRFFSFEFNGVKVSIGDDGSLSLQAFGPTKTDGCPDERDANQHGSKVTLMSSGDIVVSDEHGESVKLSPGEKRIEVLAGEQQTTVEKGWTLRASKVTVIADEVELGGEGLDAFANGVVVGSGIDTFTGQPYSALGNASSSVKAKK